MSRDSRLPNFYFESNGTWIICHTRNPADAQDIWVPRDPRWKDKFFLVSNKEKTPKVPYSRGLGFCDGAKQLIQSSVLKLQAAVLRIQALHTLNLYITEQRDGGKSFLPDCSKITHAVKEKNCLQAWSKHQKQTANLRAFNLRKGCTSVWAWSLWCSCQVRPHLPFFY